MSRANRTNLALSLLLPVVAFLVGWFALLSPTAAQTSPRLGENWLGPVGGNTVAQDLSAYGGSVYRTYYQSPFEDGEPQRIRLIRYQAGLDTCVGGQTPYLNVFGTHYCPGAVTQAVAAMTTKGLIWEMGNEVQNGGQDGGLIVPSDAPIYVRWHHDIALAIKAGDPTAKITGPNVIGWWVYCCEPYLSPGNVAYQRFDAAYLASYGVAPIMDMVSLHTYPQTVDLGEAAIMVASQVNGAADYAQNIGKGLILTEFGHWAYDWDAGCTFFGQSDDARYTYTTSVLHTLAQRGVIAGLYYGNKQQGCDGNGHASYLFEANGTLSPEGRAFRDFTGIQQTTTPTLLPIHTVIPTIAPTSTPLPESPPPVCVPQVVLEWGNEPPSVVSYTTC